MKAGRTTRHWVRVVLLCCSLTLVGSGVVGAQDGWANVRNFGARGDGRTDDTAAVMAAVQAGSTIYFPAGTYIITQTISIQNKTLIGDGMRSVIRARITDPQQPILGVGRTSVVERLRIGYDPSLITGDEQQGERVGLRTYGGPDGWVLQRGSTVRNLVIQEVGTGISDGGKGCFSVTFQEIEIKDFSFRGVDFYSRNRTGNIYSNIYLSGHRYRHQPSQGFVLKGEESEATIDQLNVEHMSVYQGIVLENVRALNAGTIHIEGVEIKAPNSTFVQLDQVTGSINAITFYYTRMPQPGTSLFRMGTAGYTMSGTNQFTAPGMPTQLDIGTLHLKGLNRPDWGMYADYPNTMKTLVNVEDFNIFYRSQEYQDRDYYVSLERYTWATFPGIADDSHVYRQFPADPHDRIVFLKKGTTRPSGPTAARPTERLVAGFTEYFDTDTNRRYYWSGEEWIQL